MDQCNHAVLKDWIYDELYELVENCQQEYALDVDADDLVVKVKLYKRFPTEKVLQPENIVYRKYTLISSFKTKQDIIKFIGSQYNSINKEWEKFRKENASSSIKNAPVPHLEGKYKVADLDNGDASK